MLAVQFIGGCAVYDVAVEERNVGTYTSDRKISFLIEEQFLKDDTIKFLDFDAYSYEGNVYLVGEYDSHAQVDKAVSIAKGVKGVKTVTTYFLPKREDDLCGTMDTMDIAAKLKNKLVGDKDIWSTNIDVEIVQCKIIMLGLVGTEKERDEAIAHAKSVPGTRGVKSFIRVR